MEIFNLLKESKCIILYLSIPTISSNFVPLSNPKYSAMPKIVLLIL
jgi:hypothetical protein